MRRQVAVAEEGLARIASLRAPSGVPAATGLWQQALARWCEVEARSVGDPLIRPEIERVDAIFRALAAGPLANSRR